MKKIKKNYTYRNAEMLLAAKTISESFREHIEKLAEYRTDWTPEYAESLRKRIDYVIDYFMELDEKKSLRAATAYLISIQDPALKDLSAFRIQVKVDFPEEKEEILRSLGFNDHFKDAKVNNSQESLIRMLVAFKLAMTPGLREKIASRGMKPELIDRILSYADNLKKANAKQEMLKESTRLITQEAQESMNNIYTEVIGICKIAYGIFSFDPIIRGHFSFGRVARNMSNIHTDNEEIAA